MDNRYFLIMGNYEDDRYNFIELFDKKDNLYYKIDNGKIEKDYLLKFDIFKDNKILINKEKFYWILDQKMLIRNIDKNSLLKMLNLHEWII
jgi:hypothetical protein